MEQAREAADSASSSERRRALSLLDSYRSAVLSTDQPQLILEVVPVVRRLARGYHEADDARQFMETTERLLAQWPVLADDFRRALLTLERETLGVRRGLAQVLLLYAVVALLVSAAGAAILVLSYWFSEFEDLQFAGAVMIPSGLGFAGLFYAAKRIRESTADAQIRNVETKAQIHTALPTVLTPGPNAEASDRQPGAEYFTNLVRINVSNLSDYYAQVRVHTNNSFWAAMVAGALGFVLVCTGVAFGFSSSRQETVAIVATASGVFVEFISGVFFYLYNRTVRQLKGYHGSLLDVQNILLAFRIVEESGRDERGPLLEQILRFLLQKRAQDSGFPAGSSDEGPS
ncbi:MAG: hypothetical protein H0U53_04810 [Actinobacteria bacterium]|nr:hypothetical protein [Actinomycetota bacterium]